MAQRAAVIASARLARRLRPRHRADADRDRRAGPRSGRIGRRHARVRAPDCRRTAHDPGPDGTSRLHHQAGCVRGAGARVCRTTRRGPEDRPSLDRPCHCVRSRGRSAGSKRCSTSRPPVRPAVRAAVVFAHPHPQQGGTMHTKVVYQAAKALNRTGCAVLRFNFRGVGTSTGRFDNGAGEADDFRAGLDFMHERHPGARCGRRGSRSAPGSRSPPAPPIRACRR